MIFTMSDIHGHFELLEKRMEQIKTMLEKEGNKLILLGDYIDRGSKSYQCLQLAYDLEQQFGAEKVIVLKGNHEVWFEEFLFENEDVWLVEDGDFTTSGTFLTEEQCKQLNQKLSRDLMIDYVKECIKENYPLLLSWMKKLRLYYETDTQIFVHAGVDEEIPEEEISWCTVGTSDEVLTGKYPPSIGHFYKDIIAGHTATSSIAKDRNFTGIFYDGESHFYIDGSAEKNGRLLCLAFDEQKNKYFEVDEDGEFHEIIRIIF